MSLQFLTGPQVGPLIIQPLEATSVAFLTTTIQPTSAESMNFPVLTENPSADWVGPGEEIPMSEMAGTTIQVIPQKVAGRANINREDAVDSNPAAASLLGKQLAGDFARKIDAAFFSKSQDLPANVFRPAGLESIPTTKLAYIDADPAVGFDAWIDALSAAEGAGAAPTAWVTDPVTASSIAKLKTGTGSNVFLLGSGAENGPSRQVLGIPLLVSPAVVPGTVWGLPRGDVYTVLRQDAEVTIDTSARFEFDQVAVRATLRAAFAFPNTAPIIKIHAA